MWIIVPMMKMIGDISINKKLEINVLYNKAFCSNLIEENWEMYSR